MNLNEREIWLKKQLKKIKKGKKILDAGAGELKYKPLCSHLKYVSQDFGQYDGQGNTDGLQTGTWDNSKLDIVSDIIDIPVKDKSFDAVMCIEVFEHIPEPILAVREFSRILKKNGTLILTVPFASLTHFAPYFFSNGYSKYWYAYALEKYGFKIKEIKYNGNYFKYLIQELRRIPVVESKYVKGSVLSKGFLFRKAVKYIVSQLSKMSEKDKGSNELLCFGIQIVATKM